jgi:hypothetical protein
MLLYESSHVTTSAIFREFLSEGNGLLCGRIPGSRGCLGLEASVGGSSGRTCCDERRKKFYRDNDSVCSGPSNINGDWRSGEKTLVLLKTLYKSCVATATGI